MNQYIVVYYNRLLNENQTFQVEAENAFRAGRKFYQKHNRKLYHACIENITVVRKSTALSYNSRNIMVHSHKSIERYEISCFSQSDLEMQKRLLETEHDLNCKKEWMDLVDGNIRWFALFERMMDDFLTKDDS